MNEIIDFVLENYIWFIIGIVVIVMVIVGYIVDKNNFGIDPEEKIEKEKKQKVKKEKKKKEEPAVIEVDNKGLNDLTNQNVENLQENNGTASTVQDTSELYAPLSQDVSSELTQEETVPQFDESLFQPLETVEVKEVAVEQPITEVAETALTPDMSFNETSNQLEQNVVSVDNVSVENVGDIEQPVIVQEPGVETPKEEDVWKF